LLIHAIRAGFRHIDSAQVYENEDADGRFAGGAGCDEDATGYRI